MRLWFGLLPLVIAIVGLAIKRPIFTRIGAGLDLIIYGLVLLAGGAGMSLGIFSEGVHSVGAFLGASFVFAYILCGALAAAEGIALIRGVSKARKIAIGLFLAVGILGLLGNNWEILSYSRQLAVHELLSKFSPFFFAGILAKKSVRETFNL